MSGEAVPQVNDAAPAPNLLDLVLNGDEKPKPAPETHDGDTNDNGPKPSPENGESHQDVLNGDADNDKGSIPQPNPARRDPRESHRATDEIAARKFCKDVVFPPHKTPTAAEGIKIDGVKAVLTRSDKLWDGLKPSIKYGFVQGQWGGSDQQRRKVVDVIEEWTWYANVTFDQVSSGAAVRVAFDPSPPAGSWSLVGKDCYRSTGDEATMNLGWISDSDAISDGERAVILHEFGHVLGMLHEHQSPAGGGWPVKRIEAAIKFYGIHDDWDRETVMQQVVERYNSKDVSSFSQVDRFSIMQYPMPASVTGLPYDIDYNYTISDMDKAYMSIMYPRPAGEQSKSEWTLEYALVKSGISREAPDTSDEILAVYALGKDKTPPTVDTERIRILFSEWCLEAHTARSEGPARGDDPARSEDPGRGLKPPIDEGGEQMDESDNSDDVDTDEDETDDSGEPDDRVVDLELYPMCSTGVIDDNDLSVGGEDQGRLHGIRDGQAPAPAHAVIDPSWLGRVKIDATKETSPKYRRTITWKIVGCPEPPSDPQNKKHWPSRYQRRRLRSAFSDWAKYASVLFEELDDRSNEAADILITFQRKDKNGDAILKTSDLRSYTRWETGVPPNVASKPQMKHTICYRGVSETSEIAEKSADPKLAVGMRNKDFDRRTLRHEIGHYLGLSHEDDGVYAHCIFGADKDFQTKVADLQDEYRGTKFDTGSVMDVLYATADLKALLKEADVRAQVRTVCGLSRYDKANIALLHPGARLTSLIKELLELADPDKCNWSKFRQTYLEALKKQTLEWTNVKAKVVETLRAYARDPDNALGKRKRSNAARGVVPIARESKPSSTLLELMYTQLNKTIGPTGAQILTLQSPTRYLAKEEFQFELNGIYSNFIKPVPVAEAEFRLTDALYDAAAIVSAPNGRSLSTVYNQILNNIVPKYEDSDRKVRQERERIRSWLLTEVGDQEPYYKYEYGTAGGGKGDDAGTLKQLDSALIAKNSFVRKMSRMEFANQLTLDYYDAQMKWELERDQMIENAIVSKDPDKLRSLTRTLVHITQSQQGKLGMKYANSVVRGYSHIVREALGHLDVATAAELLQDAKDSFRATAYSSLYGASKVYPVLMSPVDWSAALDTGFSAEDLSENPEMIIMMIQTKSHGLDVLKRQLAALQNASEGDAAALKKDVDLKAGDLRRLESDLYSKYADSTVQLAKIAIAIATDGASTLADVKDPETLASIESGKTSSAEVNKELSQSVTQLDLNGTVEDIKNQVLGVQSAQLKLQAATSAWASQRTALARAEATSTKSEQAFISNQLVSMENELAGLNARLTVAKKARDQRVKLASEKKQELKVGDLATTKPAAIGGGSRWQEINIVGEQKYTSQSSLTKGSSDAEMWSCNFWIGSAGGSNTSETGSFTSSNEGHSANIEISMKVTLVTVDRSSWFQPHLFENSGSYMKNNKNTTFNTWQQLDKKKPEDVAKAFRTGVETNTTVPSTKEGSLLPAYPVGYILCKDVFIKVSNMSMSAKEEREHMVKRSQSSGGFLFFHYNRASEESSDSSQATFEMASDGMIVRIPGPQILGYVQQIVPNDDSEAYDPQKSLGKEFYLPPQANPALSANKDDDQQSPAHASAPPGTDRQPAQSLAINFDVKPTSMSANRGAQGGVNQIDKGQTSVDQGKNTGVATAASPETSKQQQGPDAAKAASPAQPVAQGNMNVDDVMRLVKEYWHADDGKAFRAALEGALKPSAN
ncbi:hypothetical protein JX265_001922 [Neoarthrinium moseri]|uniref:Peptidase metallopeptidase domain-containing protein n=1 Tax=Neoarthrinium moseri TaxID=1658444 RepID=A0A9P9WWH6_9PEZI|nr:hypothetical protein JX265_001922 [Neoarthrinium moseri]